VVVSPPVVFVDAMLIGFVLPRVDGCDGQGGRAASGGCAGPAPCISIRGCVRRSLLVQKPVPWSELESEWYGSIFRCRVSVSKGPSICDLGLPRRVLSVLDGSDEKTRSQSRSDEESEVREEEVDERSRAWLRSQTSMSVSIESPISSNTSGWARM
jgi:hypothetical protein